MKKLQILDLELEMNPMMTFYDVLSFKYDGNEYDIQCHLIGNKHRYSRITWFQNGMELHSNRFSIAYTEIIDATLESMDPDNIIAWGIAKDKFDMIFTGLKEYGIQAHLKYMMGFYYNNAPLLLEEESKKLFSNIEYHLEGK